MSTKENLLESVLSELDIAVFLAHEDDNNSWSFDSMNQLPPWARLFLGESPAASLSLAEQFPFLEVFIPDAEDLWNSQIDGRVNSGIWTEVDGHGRQHQLEATALRLNRQPLILLTDLSRNFDERHQVFQRAREIALANERLTLELNQRQRELQDALQKKLSSHWDLSQINESVADNTSAILICNADGTIEVSNQALADIYGKTLKYYRDKQSLLEKWLEEAQQLYPEMKRAVASGAYWEGEFESTSESGKTKWIRLTIGPVHEESGKLAHYVCIANDITLLKNSAVDTEQTVEYDYLTHLPNRRTFWRLLSQTIGECSTEEASLALFYIDLDAFKRINDTLGHQAGDYVLSLVGERLSGVAMQDDFVAHLGGDEFAFVRKYVGKHIEVDSISKTIINTIGQPVQLEGNPQIIGASIGISLYPRDGKDATTLMMYSDLAMYHAKQLGRGQYQIFTPNLDYDFAQRVKLENELRQAATEKAFQLFFQPQIALASDDCQRMEVLVRWHHSQQGNISPAIFIPLAEESDLILDIGQWILESACLQAQRFIEQGMNPLIAVNVSGQQFKCSDFKQQVESALAVSGLPPQHLEIEVTETALIKDLDKVVDLLRSLRSMGISISLDDFGTGFSSLTYLKNLPIDTLKIDSSFVRELSHSEESRTITASIIKLAKELKLTVVAEGVESNEQLKFLADHGCDLIQGYLFHQPMDAKKVLDTFLASGWSPDH